MITDNVHFVRAKVNENIVTKYFGNLEKKLNVVTHGRISNYNKTVTDDHPGEKIVNINIFFYFDCNRFLHRNLKGVDEDFLFSKSNCFLLRRL